MPFAAPSGIWAQLEELALLWQIRIHCLSHLRINLNKRAKSLSEGVSLPCLLRVIPARSQPEVPSTDIAHYCFSPIPLAALKYRCDLPLTALPSTQALNRHDCFLNRSAPASNRTKMKSILSSTTDPVP
jgi:hypothetical protein